MSQKLIHHSFKNIRHLAKTSASSTIQYFAKLDGKDVFIKAYLKFSDLDAFKNEVKKTIKRTMRHQKTDDEIEQILSFVDQVEMNYMEKYDPDIKGIEYENKVYSEIISRIEKDELSPNFVEYVDHDETDIKDFLATFHAGMFDIASEDGLIAGIEYLTLHFKKDVLNKFIILNDDDTKSTFLALYLKYIRIGYLVCNRILGTQNTLHAIANSTTITEDELKEVLFQLFFTLYLMETLRLQHNDLHSDNILIEELPEMRNIFYTVSGTTFVVQTKYLLRIFDWDHAFVDDPFFGVNEKIAKIGYENAGLLNKFVKHYDYFQILCDILLDCHKSPVTLFYSICKTDIFKKLFADAIKAGILKVNSNGILSGFEIGGRFISKNNYSVDCRCNKKDDLAKLPTLEKILMNPVFSHFRGGLKTGNFHYRATISGGMTVGELLRKPKGSKSKPSSSTSKPTTSISSGVFNPILPPQASSSSVSKKQPRESYKPILPPQASSSSVSKKLPRYDYKPIVPPPIFISPQVSATKRKRRSKPSVAEDQDIFVVRSPPEVAKMSGGKKRIKLFPIADNKKKQSDDDFSPIIPFRPIVSSPQNVRTVRRRKPSSMSTSSNSPSINKRMRQSPIVLS